MIETKTYTPQGFLNRFYELCSKYKTYKEAYEAVEKEHQEYFGTRRYASYSSFNVVRYRLTNNSKKI